MLFRRFASHFRRQDWFALSLDFLVVVIGLVLSFQIDRGWEARRDRREEAIYMHRLREDAIWNVESATAELGFAQDSLDRGLLAIAYVEGDPSGAEEIAGGRIALSLIAPLRQKNGTYAELVSTGKLTLIRDHRLRQLLDEKASLDAYVEEQISYLRTRSDTLDAMLDSVTNVAVARGEGGLYRRAYSTDVVGLKAIPSIAHFMRRGVSIQALTVNRRSEQAATSQAVLERIDCLLARSCQD